MTLNEEDVQFFEEYSDPGDLIVDAIKEIRARVELLNELSKMNDDPEIKIHLQDAAILHDMFISNLGGHKAAMHNIHNIRNSGYAGSQMEEYWKEIAVSFVRYPAAWLAMERKRKKEVHDSGR